MGISSMKLIKLIYKIHVKYNVNKLKLYTPTRLDGLRKEGDSLADNAVADLMTDLSLVKEINTWDTIPRTLSPRFPDGIRAFFGFYAVPYIDKNPMTIHKAQQFFGQYGPLYLSMLGFYSLPYTYAFADGAEVLVRSRRIVGEIEMRLAETASFVMEIFRPGAFTSDERVLLVLLKVRLIHAFSRAMILKYGTDWKPGWGTPINQEDMIGSNLAFSLLVLRGMQKSGASLEMAKKKVLLDYWKMVGHYLGIRMDFWPENIKEAFVLEKMIRNRHVRPSSSGSFLVRTLIKHYEKRFNQTSISPLVESIISHFVGKEISEALTIRKSRYLPSWIYPFLFTFGLQGPFERTGSYQELSRSLRKQALHQFGHTVKINLPVFGK